MPRTEEHQEWTGKQLPQYAGLSGQVWWELQLRGLLWQEYTRWWGQLCLGLRRRRQRNFLSKSSSWRPGNPDQLILLGVSINLKLDQGKQCGRENKLKIWIHKYTILSLYKICNRISMQRSMEDQLINFPIKPDGSANLEQHCQKGFLMEVQVRKPSRDCLK